MKSLLHLNHYLKSSPHQCCQKTNLKSFFPIWQPWISGLIPISGKAVSLSWNHWCSKAASDGPLSIVPLHIGMFLQSLSEVDTIYSIFASFFGEILLFQDYFIYSRKIEK